VRDDAFGLFWEDAPTSRARGQVVRPMPPIPDTGWLPPREFPDLSGAVALSVDTETKDPNLLERGPGWARGDGHIIGVSVAVTDRAWYFPVRHEVEPEYNMDPEHVFAWLRDTMKHKRQPKVGANLIYDLGWLAEEGVEVMGDLMDVQLAEALLDERGEVNVDFLGLKYLGQGKETSLLYQWCADFYGGEPTGKQRANLWRAPPRLVGPYAEMDAVVPLKVARCQYPQLAGEGLLDLLKMENGLIRLMIAMRRAGVTVDINRAEQLREKLFAMEAESQRRLDLSTGVAIDVNSPDGIARAFDSAGVKYPLTPTGKPSFRKEWLEHLHHPIAEQILAVRKVQKLRGTFVESYILNSHVNGKVHGQFHLLRSDEGGTRSGRFASSTPNLQNIPSRDPELAPLVRGMFIPDPGHLQWRRYDYSQIEYRFLVHFAEGPGAEEARNQFRNDPDTDYHDFVINMIHQMTGYKLDRKPAKNINFGLIYGMGIKKLLRTLGLSDAEGKQLFDAYHTAIPYAKAAMEECSEMAMRTGVMTTILGRRSRFDLWEPIGRAGSERMPGLPYELAIRKYGARIQRSMAHKALNRRLQGSAADMMKYCMWCAWEDGVFDYVGVPRLTVHDELDFSDTGEHPDGWAYLQNLLENALPLRVPVKCEPEVGPDWGAAK
jgi:DNA polymerase I-like protein with 3'-5' exonuclease and polymerase domains